MKSFFPALFALCLSAVTVFATDPPPMTLEPNAIIHFDFPNLPPTYYAHSNKNTVPAQLTAQLPSNYSATGKFPLFVFLSGGAGGQADAAALKGVRAAIGDQDFIAVTLPLFKNSAPSKADNDDIPRDMPADIPPAIVEAMRTQSTGFPIKTSDYPVIAPSYATMLTELYNAVPNIDPDRSVIAGMSNGAHTIGALLGRNDPFILAHFHSFGFIEGGTPMVIKGKDVWTPAMKSRRFLILWGAGSDVEKAKNPNLAMVRPYAIEYLKQFVRNAAALDVDVTLVLMANTGHEFPPQYRALLKNWAQGGKVPSS